MPKLFSPNVTQRKPLPLISDYHKKVTILAGSEEVYHVIQKVELKFRAQSSHDLS